MSDDLIVFYTDDVLRTLCDFLNDPDYQFDIVTGRSLDKQTTKDIEETRNIEKNSIEIDIQKEFKIPFIFDFQSDNLG